MQFAAHGARRILDLIEARLVVEEFGSTTVVFPRQVLTVDPHGILIIRTSPPSPLALRDSHIAKTDSETTT